MKKILIFLFSFLFISFLFGQNVFAETLTVYSGADTNGKYGIEKRGSGQQGWATVRGASTGTMLTSTYSAIRSRFYTTIDDFTIDRNFYYFDLADLPSGAEITDVKLQLWATANANEDNDGYDFVSVHKSSPNDYDTLVLDDFDQCEGGEISDRVDLSGFVAYTYESVELEIDDYTDIVADEIYTICMREGHDSLNHQILGSGGTGYSNYFISSRNIEDSKPYLVITYTTSECGDGTIDSGEECDDGNTTAGDGCDNVCISEYCGDSIINNTNEECDDGNTTANDGCDATCNIEFTNITFDTDDFDTRKLSTVDFGYNGNCEVLFTMTHTGYLTNFVYLNDSQDGKVSYKLMGDDRVDLAVDVSSTTEKYIEMQVDYPEYNEYGRVCTKGRIDEGTYGEEQCFNFARNDVGYMNEVSIRYDSRCEDFPMSNLYINDTLIESTFVSDNEYENPNGYDFDDSNLISPISTIENQTCTVNEDTCNFGINYTMEILDFEVYLVDEDDISTFNYLDRSALITNADDSVTLEWGSGYYNDLMADVETSEGSKDYCLIVVDDYDNSVVITSCGYQVAWINETLAEYYGYDINDIGSGTSSCGMFGDGRISECARIADETVGATTTCGWYQLCGWAYTIKHTSIETGCHLVYPSCFTSRSITNLINSLTSKFPFSLYKKMYDSTFYWSEQSHESMQVPLYIGGFNTGSSTITAWESSELEDTYGETWNRFYNAMQMIIFGLTVIYLTNLFIKKR